ncbi:MAG: methyltransferase domain-containing protein [Caldilineaceae bacterium]
MKRAELRGCSNPIPDRSNGQRDQTLEPTTLALFERIGIAPGMACLDVGCGGGDVTRLLAHLVGRRVRVVGIDFDAEISRLATADADAAGLDQVSYRLQEGEIDEADHRNNTRLLSKMMIYLLHSNQCSTALPLKA